MIKDLRLDTYRHSSFHENVNGDSYGDNDNQNSDFDDNLMVNGDIDNIR